MSVQVWRSAQWVVTGDPEDNAAVAERRPSWEWAGAPESTVGCHWCSRGGPENALRKYSKNNDNRQAGSS